MLIWGLPSFSQFSVLSTQYSELAEMALLELHDVHAYYGNIHALKGVSLSVDEGEIVTLIGSNGAGKSTTLRTISGLLNPRQGQIVFKIGRASCRERV